VADPVEPSPPHPPPTRVAEGPFPRYRYIPGRSPHPRRDRLGHSWGAPEPRTQALDAGAWRSSALYLRGVDLYNHAYFWESHEAWEALWRGSTEAATVELLQALIQIAASEIKRFAGSAAAAQALAGRAIDRLAKVPSPWLGLDVRALEREVVARRAGERPVQAVLTLDA
jgi:hypothetical protein